MLFRKDCIIEVRFLPVRFDDDDGGGDDDDDDDGMFKSLLMGIPSSSQTGNALFNASLTLVRKTVGSFSPK